MANRQNEDLTRAEKLRAQQKTTRSKPVEPPFGSSATRKQTQRKVPVTQRKPYTPPVVNRKRGKVPLTLQRKGAEVQLPALPRLQLGWRLISGLIFLLSLTAVVSFASVDTFKVSAINLEGAERLSSDAILSQVNIQNLSIIKIQPDEIEAQIAERFPGLSSVRVSVGLPAAVTVKVTERQPLVLWQQETNALWIDAEGVMFPVWGEAEVPLTVIAASNPPESRNLQEETAGQVEAEEETNLDTGLFDTYPRTTPEFVRSILLLNQHLPEGTPLQYDPEFGLGWQDPAGWLVYFGKDIKDMETKLTEYQAIIETIKARSLSPALISLEFMHAPFYRMEQ